MTPNSSKYPSVDDIVADLASHIRGKVILTTGISPGGLGACFVEAIAKAEPKCLLLATRKPDTATVVASSINNISPSTRCQTIHLDLASFASVREAAAQILRSGEPIDVIVNNAGIMATPYTKTEDGFESQLQCNYLSHFLLTNLLLESSVKLGYSTTVVNISSSVYQLGHVRYYDYNFHDGESYDPWRAYGSSKTASMLYSRALASRLGALGVFAYSVDPGVIRTNLPRYLDSTGFDALASAHRQVGNETGWTEVEWLQPKQGVAMYVYAGFSPDAKKHIGAFLRHFDEIPVPEQQIHPWAVGELEASKCWSLSEKLVGQRFDFQET